MRQVPLTALVAALLRRPGLWGVAVRTLLATARKGWWRFRPFIPQPDPHYLDWRIVTAYGNKDSAVVVDDVVAFLEWCKRQRT